MKNFNEFVEINKSIQDMISIGNIISENNLDDKLFVETFIKALLKSAKTEDEVKEVLALEADFLQNTAQWLGKTVGNLQGLPQQYQQAKAGVQGNTLKNYFDEITKAMSGSGMPKNYIDTLGKIQKDLMINLSGGKFTPRQNAQQKPVQNQRQVQQGQAPTQPVPQNTQRKVAQNQQGYLNYPKKPQFS